MASIQLGDSQSRLDFFQQRIVHAIEHWANHEAVQQVEIKVLDLKRETILRAIALGLEFEPAWPIVKRLMIAFTPYMERRGHWDAWNGVLEQAIGMAQQADDMAAETTLTALLARLCQRMSRPDDVVRHYRRVIRLAQRTDNRFEEARACSNLGYLYIDRGKWWRSEVLSKHALTVFEELGSQHGRAHTRNHLGILYLRQERWDDARINLVAACDIWQITEDSHSLLYGYMNLGLLEIESENYQQALNILMKAYETSSAVGEVSNKGKILHNIAIAHYQKMDWVEAEKHAKKAEKIFREFSDEQGLADVWQSLGVISMNINQDDQAIEYFEESLAMNKKLRNTERERRVRNAINQVAALSSSENAATWFKSLAILDY